jgi:hypothetical protein
MAMETLKRLEMVLNPDTDQSFTTIKILPEKPWVA